MRNITDIAAARPTLLVGPRDRARVVRAIFRSYQLTWIEYLGRDRTSPGRSSDARLKRAELLYRALARGRGAVIAAPHTGNWELAGLAFARLGFTVHVVTGVQLDPRLTGAMRAMKERERIRVSTPEDGFSPLLATLRQGGVVVLLVDGDIHTRSIDAPFFGRSVPFPAGPAILARRARAPLVHAHAERAHDGTHWISFDALDEADPTLPLSADLRRLTARVAAVLEDTVAAHLTQWCVFRPFHATDAA